MPSGYVVSHPAVTFMTTYGHVLSIDCLHFPGPLKLVHIAWHLHRKTRLSTLTMNMADLS